MNVSEPFILRPVGTSLLMAAIMLSGMVAYTFLPLSTLPEVDYPTIQVQTLYPGASPEVMTSSVTAPLERQFGQMPGLNQMTSASSAGASVITLQFSLDLSLDIAEQEVQAAINAAGNLLPADLPAPPIYAKVNPADAPILTLAVTSKTLALTDLEDYSETRLAQKISQLTGVGLVSISGGQRPAVRIQLNPHSLAAYGLNVDDVRTTIGNLNVNTPKGNFDGPTQALTINANDQLTSADQYRNLIVAYRNGAPVKLSDVATIVSGPENTKLGAWANTTPAIIVNVQRQPGANIIQVVDRIQALLPQIMSTLPPAIDVRVHQRPHRDHPRLGRRRRIRAGARRRTGRAGDLRVPAHAAGHHHPEPVGAAVARRHVRSDVSARLFSLDNLSLMALTIATGFVVDDAIVMIENIARYVEGGMDPLEAALRGSAQIGFTIISLTISLIAVLIPLLFMGDVVGRLFHEFSITLAVTIVISAVVSLTLVPMMCAKLIRHRPDRERSAFDLKAEQVFNAVIAHYGRALELGAGPAAGDAAGRGPDARLDRAALCPDPEGILSGAGHRDDPGHHRSLAEHLLRRHGGPAGQACRSDPEGSRRRQPKLLHRRRRHQPDAQYRPLPDHAQAARRPQPDRQPDHPPPAERGRRRRRHHALHAAGAGPDDRFHHQPRALSFRAGRRQCRRNSTPGCRNWCSG